MQSVSSVAIAFCLAVAACDHPDPCLASKQVRFVSPSGNRIATVYPGGCHGVILAPQVIVEFRTEQGRGGGGVFAVRDSAAQMEVRWIGEDTLEVSYPTTATVEKREPLLQFGDARLHVVYRARPSTDGRPMLRLRPNDR